MLYFVFDTSTETYSCLFCDILCMPQWCILYFWYLCLYFCILQATYAPCHSDDARSIRGPDAFPSHEAVFDWGRDVSVDQNFDTLNRYWWTYIDEMCNNDKITFRCNYQIWQTNLWCYLYVFVIWKCLRLKSASRWKNSDL